jgi:CRISPR-associated protein Csm1
MSAHTMPGLNDVAVGAFLHDIGKLYQRAAGSERDLPEPVRNLESEILPRGEHGRYTHRHALFTAGFFDLIEQARLPLPAGMSLEQARVCAVYHHHPDPSRPWTWIVAEADRLSSGMDRKERDIADELGAGPRGRDAYRRTPLRSLLATVDLELGPTLARPFPVAELTPDAIFPTPDLDPNSLPAAYAACWQGFRAGFEALCREGGGHAELFHDGLMSLSERFTWAVPSSTVDQPDVSLHDHGLSVAAIATCLHAWHAERDGLLDLAAIRNKGLPKYRLLEGDLSGIQATLFRLARQQVKGVNRILRARSFLLGSLVETAALLVRCELGLPPYVVLQRAGGKFLMLLPALDGLEARLDALRERIDRWLVDTYAGDLALILALGPAFGGEGSHRSKWRDTYAELKRVAEEAKLRPLATAMAEPVLQSTAYEEGADGACQACGVRPALPPLRCLRHRGAHGCPAARGQRGPVEGAARRRPDPVPAVRAGEGRGRAAPRAPCHGPGARRLAAAAAGLGMAAGGPVHGQPRAAL